jgi:hypothetical protein
MEVVGPGVPGSVVAGELGDVKVVAMQRDGDLVGAAPFQVKVANTLRLRCGVAGTARNENRERE